MIDFAQVSDLDDALKAKFAHALLRLKNPSQAALETLPGSTIDKMVFAQELPNDPFVIAEMERLREELGEMAFLPSKADIVRDILERSKTANNADYEKLMRLAASMMDYIPKPGQNVDVSVQVANVMQVVDHGSDEQWAAKAQAQQARLIENAAS